VKEGLKAVASVRSLVNLRDVGGGIVRRGVLFRSESGHGLSPGQARELVETLGIRHVFDLRTDLEVEADGCGPLLTLTSYERKPIDGRAGGTSPPANRSTDELAGRYLGYLGHSRASIVGTLRGIARSDGAVLVHCRAGKDRTGVIVAICLALVGVIDSEIVKDYMLTNAAMPAIIAGLRASQFYSDNVEGWPDHYYRVHPDTMLGFLELVRQTYGGFHEWAFANGLTDTEFDMFRSRLRAGT
jgi:protein-tyrosine phosphatase